MPPIKPVKISDKIIYGHNNIYKMASLVDTSAYKAGTYLGKMKVMPQKDELYIAILKSRYPQNKEAKIGTGFINAAKQISKRLNLGGRLRVEAYNPEYGGKHPHQFYRKMGFTTKDKKADELLDFTIQWNLDIPPYMRQGTTMYYIPKK